MRDAKPAGATVTLAYGRQGLPVRFDRPIDVLEPDEQPALKDAPSALTEALRAPIDAAPLREQATPRSRVAIVIADGTRPAPNRELIAATLGELSHVPSEQITILVATGLHRPATDAELAAMVGPDVAGSYRVINHDARDSTGLADIGATSSGRPVVVNRAYLEADLRVTLGLIEPHFFAGFSGGAKLILPGVAGAASILRNHDAEMIGHANARWGVRQGNPVFEEQREAARLAGCEFCLNVTIDRERQITGVFGGALEAAHDAGCEAALASTMLPVDAPYDVVVTTNGGHPLDLNLYQTVKGMDAAAQIVRPGGSIVMAAECAEGTGHGAFADILRDHADPESMRRSIEHSDVVRHDQWQNQILARVLDRAAVHLHSSGLTDTEVRDAFIVPCPDVAQRVGELAANGARVGVLPRGPETIPVVDPA